ncbi:hypothetical protein A1507_19530 [Methylomonas koyamae]|uniref:Abasic site processing protein n=1 Tax=Methylomonas koyamae TaxID=702114 RepID=A0A177N437_9GAMM|nr:SOS response-associated peptidase [Methylomonas koyamae]OAI11900.1 hypothetical protein A1507_19530 [Methylomonas koyamae]
MCGRYSLTATSEELAEHFRVLKQVCFEPSFNIPPGQKILNIVARADGSRKAVNLLWGLVPPWAKDRKIGWNLSNARRETLTEKPAFREALKRQRCLIPADGYFEWQKRAEGKQAFHIHREDRKLFAFAGLWEQWIRDEETLYSCTIITTAANASMRAVHERMPVIMPPAYYQAWLDKTAGTDAVLPLLDNDAYVDIAMTPVSDWVNNPRHNDARCVESCRS